MARPRRQFYQSDAQYQEVVYLYDQIDTLRGLVNSLKAGMSASQSPSIRGLESSVAIPAVADPNATAQVYPAGIINPNVSVSSVSGGSTGFTFNLSGGISTMSVSSAATVRAAISAAAAAAPGAGTITLAKITGGGANGSLTITAEGVISAYTAPT